MTMYYPHSQWGVDKNKCNYPKNCRKVEFIYRNWYQVIAYKCAHFIGRENAVFIIYIERLVW